MKIISLVIVGLIFSIFFSCRKKHKDVEVEFLLVGGSRYCGEFIYHDGTQFCPTEIRVVSTGNRYVFNHPLDTTITNAFGWWNKRYIVTLIEEKEICECNDPESIPLPGEEELIPSKKSVVRIKEIHLKE